MKGLLILSHGGVKIVVFCNIFVASEIKFNKIITHQSYEIKKTFTNVEMCDLRLIVKFEFNFLRIFSDFNKLKLTTQFNLYSSEENNNIVCVTVNKKYVSYTLTVIIILNMNILL